MDAPGVYLDASLIDDKKLLIKFDGEYVDIMCEVKPEHKPNMRTDHGKNLIYIQVLKVIYGMI